MPGMDFPMFVWDGGKISGGASATVCFGNWHKLASREGIRYLQDERKFNTLNRMRLPNVEEGFENI